MTDLEDRVTKLESRLGGISEVATAHDGDIEAIQREVASLRQEIDSMRADLQDVRNLADMLQPDPDTSMSKEQRGAHALLTLYRKASAASDGTAALDAGGVVDANQGQIKRAYAYEIMRAVPDLVNDDGVCWLKTEDRSSKRNTRVVLDLTNGDVPASTEGVRIHDGGSGGEPADD